MCLTCDVDQSELSHLKYKKHNVNAVKEGITIE